MQNVLYIFAMRGPEVGLLLGVIAGSWLIGLIIFWLYYGLCSLSAGLAMRLGYTFSLLLFLVSIFFVFPQLTRFFAFWQYSPAPRGAVLNDAILVLALSVIWLFLMWALWPRPRRHVGTL